MLSHSVVHCEGELLSSNRSAVRAELSPNLTDPPKDFSRIQIDLWT